MLNIPASLILEKNKLNSTYPWLLLIDVTTPVSTMYFVRNTEDIIFNGITYTAFPFDMEVDKQDTKGQIPSMSLRVSNVTRAVQAEIEQYGGLVGETVTLRIVNSAYLSENYSELTFDFEIIACSATAIWVTFVLGAPNLLAKRFPLYRYMSNFCRYVSYFKGPECGYSGGLTVCNGTLANCQERLNSERFGGFLGLSPIPLRLV